MPLVTEPHAQHHTNAVGLCSIEQVLRVVADAPGADGVSTRFGEELELILPAGTLDAVRLTVDQQLPAGLGRFELDLIGGHLSDVDERQADEGAEEVA